MNRLLTLTLLLFFGPLVTYGFQAGSGDSLAAADSATKKALTPAAWIPIQYDSLAYTKTIRSNPYFNFGGAPVMRTIQVHVPQKKEGLFYVMAGLFLLLALIRVSFVRYFQNLFAVFFRASMKQKQIREQLLQTPLASLLLNLFFVAVAGLFASFVLHEMGTNAARIGFWILFGYSVAAIAALYTGKYFVLKMLGWTLQMEQTTDTYIFIVFLCNKVLAIFLLPLLAVMAFASPELGIIALTLAWVLIAGIFLYRYISSYGYINREVRTSRFHFFLYLCAFEVAPLLLIYKVLLNIV